MKLEFKNGVKLDVITIFGGPTIVDGVMRDTLRIEMDYNKYEMQDLKTIFTNTEYTDELYSITDETKNKIGDGYNIFISIGEELRRLAQVPGTLTPPRTETRYVAVIAQETYAERQLRILQEGG